MVRKIHQLQLHRCRYPKIEFIVYIIKTIWYDSLAISESCHIPYIKGFPKIDSFNGDIRPTFKIIINQLINHSFITINAFSFKVINLTFPRSRGWVEGANFRIWTRLVSTQPNSHPIVTLFPNLTTIGTLAPSTTIFLFHRKTHSTIVGHCRAPVYQN